MGERVGARPCRCLPICPADGMGGVHVLALLIERPIFASVLSMVINPCGRRGRGQPAVAQYPADHATRASWSCVPTPGANDHVVADSVAPPSSSRLMASRTCCKWCPQSNNDGTYTLTVHFHDGRQPELRPGAGAKPHQSGLAALARRGAAGGRSPPASAIPTSCSSSPSIRPTRAYDQLYLGKLWTIHLKDEIAASKA